MNYKQAGVIFLLSLFAYFSACSFREKEKSMKDLGENMLDLRIYHENLGDALVEKNKEYALWFVHDMDSILNLMADKFTTHRKLKEPFKNHYRKRLAPYIDKLKNEINNEEWTRSVQTYSILTMKCNGCHIDHNVDKEIKDATKH